MKQAVILRTQRDQVVERLGAIGTKALSARVARAAGTQAARLAGRTASRAASPLLLAADGLQFGTEVLLTQLGCEAETAELAGEALGMGGSAAIGAACGSPGGILGMAIGAGTGAAVWLLGEIVGRAASQMIAVMPDWHNPCYQGETQLGVCSSVMNRFRREKFGRWQDNEACCEAIIWLEELLEEL